MIAPAAAAQSELSREIPLASGWEMSIGEGRFVPAHVPGTVASILREQNAWRMGDEARFDASDYSFRCRFGAGPAAPGEEIVLRIGGIATLACVTLNGETILESSSMFASHDVNVTPLIRGENELRIDCHSLSTTMREKRGRKPAARWRTRVVSEQNLRWFRTTMLGRAPGFSPEPEPVGPWRPVSLIRRRRIALENWSRKVELDGTTGVVGAELRWRVLDEGSRPKSGWLRVGEESEPLNFEDSFARAALRIPRVARWWPHTHGDPVLYPVRVELELADGSTAAFDDLPAGFRTIDPGVERPGDDGLALSVNGTRVFCRGVAWTPPDVVSLSASPEVVRRNLELLRDAGFNMIRLAGTMIYETETFHRLCDELGLLLWQDMMFANLDYPLADPEFHETVLVEAEGELTRISRHASTAVICGNSEIEQQAGMLGLDPAIARGAFFGEELPAIAARCCPGVPYVPSAPCGGDQAFRTRRGVANYFGVGAYLRPLEDVRRAEVKFASECLAFANVPEPEMIDKIALRHRGGISPVHFGWKRGAARDSGPGWDFEDVRDHYLKMLYAVEPAALRYCDMSRYWELSRMVSGEVMAEVFGEWRRAESSCNGGIVLWSADLEPGAGWGILDSDGRPKAAYWFLKRALAPQTVWMTDEGLNGVDIHVANDHPGPMDAILRVALYRLGEYKVAEEEIAITVPAAAPATFGVEEILGRFVDASYAFRFGPPGHDLIVASLHRERGDVPFAQSFRFPIGRPLQRIPIDRLDITAESGGPDEIVLSAKRFAWGVRVGAPGFLPGDAYFGIEPGGKKRLTLACRDTRQALKPFVTAVNAEGRLPL